MNGIEDIVDNILVMSIKGYILVSHISHTLIQTKTRAFTFMESLLFSFSSSSTLSTEPRKVSRFSCSSSASNLWFSSCSFRTRVCASPINSLSTVVPLTCCCDLRWSSWATSVADSLREFLVLRCSWAFSSISSCSRSRSASRS